MVCSQKWTVWLVAITLLLLPETIYPTIKWTTDYKKALETSQTTQKSILLYFNGSDWSGWGMKMKNEVLDSKAFETKIISRLVCVEIDFPRHSSLSPEETLQNTQLKEQYNIEEYPTLILIDGQEREITRLAYHPTNGEVFAGDLLRILQQDTQLCRELDKLADSTSQQLRELYHIAQELQRPTTLHSILAVGLERSDPFFLLEKYRLLVEEGKMTSQECLSLRQQLVNSEDLEVHFRVATIDFQELAKKSSEVQKPNEIVKPLEDYLMRFGEIDHENVWRIEMMIAQFYLESDEWRTALQHAETAYQAAPEEIRPTIEHSLNYITNQAKQIAQK